MKNEEEIENKLKSRIKGALSTSGLLFQPHPNLGSWKTTRAGFEPAEVLAFKNDNADVRRLYLRHYRKGESLEASEEPLKEDTWIVDIMDEEQEYLWEERFHGSLDEAVEDMADLMLDISESREPKKLKEDVRKLRRKSSEKVS